MPHDPRRPSMCLSHARELRHVFEHDLSFFYLHLKASRTLRGQKRKEMQWEEWIRSGNDPNMTLVRVTRGLAENL